MGEGRNKSGNFPFGPYAKTRGKCRAAGSGLMARNPMPELGGIGCPKDADGLFMSGRCKIAPGV